MQRFAKSSRRKRATSRRRGQMLLMFFFFLLAFLPLMALIVDLSLVRLARREMQSAVNAAALEGLRGKGLSEYVSRNGEPQHDLLQRRRNSADLRIPITDEGREWWDNGPDVDERFRFRLGFTTELELNLDNAVNGDLVAGKYIHGPQDDEGYDHREGFDRKHPDYPFDRRDFIPFSTETEVVHLDVDGAESEAFLARRRRTSRDESVPGVSSQEMPVPVFFGHFWPSIEGVRENHVTVRAAAIAAARPAMIVGPPLELPIPTSDLPYHIGAAPFAMEVATDVLDEASEVVLGWSDFAEEVPYLLVERDNIEGEEDTERVWVLVVADDPEREIPVIRITVTGPLAFGTPLVEDPAQSLEDVLPREYYLPIYGTFPMIDLPSVRLAVGSGGIVVREVNGDW